MTFSTANVGAVLDAVPVAGAAIAVIDPLAAQVDTVLSGGIGLGGTLADLQAQIDGAIAASLAVASPTWAAEAILAAQQMIAAIQLAISLGMPAVDVTVVPILVAELQAKLGAINAMISATASLKLGATALSAQIGTTLSSGPVKILSWSPPGTTAPEVQSQVSSFLSSLSGDTYGILLCTQSPSAWAGISFALKVT